MTWKNWVDLAATAPGRAEVRADVCIVGAGAAGVYLAARLAGEGVNVVLLEAGPGDCVAGEAAGFDVEFELEHYSGATAGRYFGIGGSTSRWGGALVPCTERDLRPGDDSVGAWECIVRTVEQRSGEVLRRLGYPVAPEFDLAARRYLGPVFDVFRKHGIDLQASLQMPFRGRNLAGLLSSAPARGERLQAFFNAAAKSWTLACIGGVPQVVRLVAGSRNGRDIEVVATQFVVAAGAIESARILLEIVESTAVGSVRASPFIGCHLSDHLSTPIAEVVAGDRALAIRQFAPRFARGWMRAFRFLRKETGTHSPRAFAHMIFARTDAGFGVAKEFLGAIQARRWPSIAPRSVVAGMGDLARLAYHRAARSALYVPRGTPVLLQLDVEQIPARENLVRLASDRDEHGRRKVRIRWAVTDADATRIAKAAREWLARWPPAESGLPRLRPLAINQGSVKPHDSYHPVGTCRMGNDDTAVVDADSKVRGFGNLWVASTGVLPSAGSANPTFTMLCLADGLADGLAAASRRIG